MSKLSLRLENFSLLCGMLHLRGSTIFLHGSSRSHLINTARVRQEAAYPHRIGLKKARKPLLIVLRNALNPPPKPFNEIGSKN